MNGREEHGIRQFELNTLIPASADSTWEVLSDISGWPALSSLFPKASGRLVEGSVLDLLKRDASGEVKPFRPRVTSVEPPTRFVLEAGFGPSGALRLVHTFVLEPAEHGVSVLRQTWTTATPLDDARWQAICAGITRFQAFGEGLASCMAATGQAYRAGSQTRRLQGSGDTGCKVDPTIWTNEEAT